jgi:hypothetical protein
MIVCEDLCLGVTRQLFVYAADGHTERNLRFKDLSGAFSQHVVLLLDVLEDFVRKLLLPPLLTKPNRACTARMLIRRS